MVLRPQQQKQRLRIDTHSHRVRVDNHSAKMSELIRRPKNVEFVENALVINLPRSTQRLSDFKRANTFDGATEIIEAIDGLLLTETKMLSQWKGDSACLASHKKALQYAKDKNYPMVMVFEDDVEFVTFFSEKVREAMSELPDNWDMFWLGGKDRYKSVPYSKSLKLNTGMWGAYGFVIRNSVYDFFIEKFAEDRHSTDDYYSEYHSNFVSFKSATDLVIHIGTVSDRITVNHEQGK